MSKVQSVLFPKELFTRRQATAWIKANNFILPRDGLGRVLVDETAGMLRYRQFDPTDKPKRTKTLPNGVLLVLELKKK
jgi:hypothetical protein